MRILHISDVHYRQNFSNINTYESILSNMDSSLSKLNTLLNEVKDIDCIVITGDLCDDGTSNDYLTLKRLLDDTNIPYFVCLGNHDNKQEFYKGWFNKDDNRPYLSISNFNGLNIISFDNSEYGHPNGYVDDNRLAWLNNVVSNSSNCLVLMHHQAYDMPGIPGLKDDELSRILNNRNVLCVLNGHTHWYKEDDKFYTAPSISFRAKNEDGEVVFYDCFGYCLYEVSNDSIKLIEEKDKENKLLGSWNPKQGKLY